MTSTPWRQSSTQPPGLADSPVVVSLSQEGYKTVFVAEQVRSKVVWHESGRATGGRETLPLCRWLPAVVYLDLPERSQD